MICPLLKGEWEKKCCVSTHDFWCILSKIKCTQVFYFNFSRELDALFVEFNDFCLMGTIDKTPVRDVWIQQNTAMSTTGRSGSDVYTN